MYSMTQMKTVNVVLLTKIVNDVLLTTLITETKIFLVRYMALSTVVFFKSIYTNLKYLADWLS